MTRGKNKVSRTTAELTRIPVLTVDQTAQLIGCSATTIRRRLKSGTMTGKILDNRWHIPSMQFFLPSTRDRQIGNIETPALDECAQVVRDDAGSYSVGADETKCVAEERMLSNHSSEA